MSVALVRRSAVAIRAPGLGYIAGEAPEGLATFDNVPGRAVIDLLRRSDHAWLRRTISADNGTYRFDGLTLDVPFNVLGRDPSETFGDVIVSRVLPYAAPQITTASLAFQVGMPPNLQMAVQYGAAPFAWTVTGAPPGLSLSAAGEWGGLATTPGSYPVTVTVLDTYGEPHSRTYTAVVT